MKIIEPGHIYELAILDEQPELADLGTPSEQAYMKGACRLVFVNREPGHEHPGTQTQEVLRALIDRTYHCDNCLPHELNAFIIHHLRMALVYHEMRALQRKAEKGEYWPEEIKIGHDGHFDLRIDADLAAFGNQLMARRREFELKPTQQTCTYREY